MVLTEIIVLGVAVIVAVVLFKSHFRQVDVKIHLIYLLISIFLKRSEINFNKKLLNVDHNIINIYFITNGGHDNFDNK